jgi:hypothetical protein
MKSFLQNIFIIFLTLSIFAGLATAEKATEVESNKLLNQSIASFQKGLYDQSIAYFTKAIDDVAPVYTVHPW